MVPCDCQFKICRDCYIDALNGSGKCPGCKDEYKILDEPIMKSSNNSSTKGTTTDTDLRALPPPSTDSGNKNLERRLSLLKTQPNNNNNNQSSDFDSARWLYQTKGTYGYGNALWPKSDGYTGPTDTSIPPAVGAQPDFVDKARRPLSRKISVSAGILSPYRYAMPKT